MTDKETILGNPISVSWDKIDGKDWIVIRDGEGKEIMRIDKVLWNNQNSINCGFSPTMRDSILERARRLFG